MPVVWYTNKSFQEGELIDTHDFWSANREALLDFPPEVSEVERFLEEVRLGLDPELPSRLYSILTIPWPDREVVSQHKDATGRILTSKSKETTDPPGAGTHCYYVIPKVDTKHLMVDERWVRMLVAQWPDIAGSEEAMDMAISYWKSEMVRYEFGGVEYLFEGKVLVQSVCRTPTYV